MRAWSKISSTIIVNNLTPNQIWTSFTVRSHVETVTANGTDDACKETGLGRYHWNNAVATGDSINFSGKKLISPMSVRARVISSQNGSDTSGPFPTSYNTVSSNQNIQFGKVKIADDCWRDHRGGYRVGVVINYSDKEFSYWASESHGWGGNSDGMYVDRVDKF